jgi:hypothetical protein
VVSATIIAIGAGFLIYVDRQRFVVAQRHRWAQLPASVDSTQHA